MAILVLKEFDRYTMNTILPSPPFKVRGRSGGVLPLTKQMTVIEKCWFM